MITFSLCHATARLPYGWRDAMQTWVNSCDDISRIEYILAVDTQDKERWPTEYPGVKLVENTKRPCCVDAWNASAAPSVGKVIIAMADDFYPPGHWDTELLKVIPDLDGEYVVETRSGTGADDEWRRLITHPMMTRAYYERRGSRIYHPDYESMYCDDDFTEVARRDGVVIDARHLLFEHRHWIGTSVAHDEVYQRTGAQDRHDRGILTLGARRATGYPI